MTSPIRIAPGARSIHLSGKRRDERYDDNQLAVLAEHTDVEECHLGRQRIRRLPAGLAQLPRLVRLTLRDCPDLETLDGIAALTTLRSLELVHTPKLDLGSAFTQLAELPDFVELAIGGDELRVMPPSITRLHSLLRLGVHYCALLDFTAACRVLADIDTLRTLESLQRGTRMPDEALAPLAQITKLVLGSRLAAIPASVGTMARLEILELAGNHLTELPATIGRLVRLRELAVPASQLTALPDAICRCAALERLDISGNPITALPAELGDLHHLRVLLARATALTALPDSIGSLGALRELELPLEGLHDIPDSVFELALDRFTGPAALAARIHLRPPPTPQEDSVTLTDPDRIPADLGDPRALGLALAGNPMLLPPLARLVRLETIELDIGNLAEGLHQLACSPRLTTLTLRGDHEVVPATLGELPALEVLRIQLPKLRELPDALGELTTLTELYIVEKPPLARLPDTIGALAALRTLGLTASVVELPPAIGKLHRLQTLVLDLGRLTAFPDALADCRELATLVMGGLHCGPARFDVLARLPRLTSLQCFDVHGLSVPRLFDALADSTVEELRLRVAMTEVPATIGCMRRLRLVDFGQAPLEVLPGELRDCTALREIALRIDRLPAALVADTRRFLPAGQWRKTVRHGLTTYSRTD